MPSSDVVKGLRGAGVRTVGSGLAPGTGPGEAVDEDVAAVAALGDAVSLRAAGPAVRADPGVGTNRIPLRSLQSGIVFRIPPTAQWEHLYVALNCKQDG